MGIHGNQDQNKIYFISEKDLIEENPYKNSILVEKDSKEKGCIMG